MMGRSMSPIKYYAASEPPNMCGGTSKYVGESYRSICPSLLLIYSYMQMQPFFFLSYIKKQMDEKGLYKKYTMQTLLDDLDIIELYQQPGKAHHLSEITKKQMALYDAMGVAIPK